MPDREETLRKIEAFNKRAEDLHNAAFAPPVIPDVGDATILNAPVGSLSTSQRIERQAVQTSSDVANQQREQQAAERARQQEEGGAIDRMQQAGSDVVENAFDATQKNIRWLESIPTPAGLGTILALIVVFLLAVVPVDAAGNTRMKLIWLTLTGKTHLAPLGGTNNSTTPGFGNLPPRGRHISFPVPTSQPTTNLNVTIPDLTGINLFGL